MLWENLNLKFTPEQEQQLAQKYNVKGDGRVHYKSFCQVINQPFNANDLGMHPDTQKVEAREL